MKKLAAFLMILSISVFSVGCSGKTVSKTVVEETPAPTGEAAHEQAPADGGAAAPEEGKKTEAPAEPAPAE